MSENQTDQTDYQKGFNEGYLIAEHLPDLSLHLSRIDNDAPRIEGIKDGGQQYVLDRAKEFTPSWLKTNRVVSPAAPRKDKDKDRDLER